MKINTIILLLLISYNAYANNINEIKIEPQEVMVWNQVNLEILSVAESDLLTWCNSRFKNNCIGNSVKTFLNLSRNKIFYEFDLDGVDDLVAIYIVKIDHNGNNKIIGKSWVSSWSHAFTKVIPFSRPKK